MSRARFEDVFRELVGEIVGYLESLHMASEAIEWYKRNLLHNTLGGKLNRGLAVVDTVRILLGRELNEKTYHDAAILGWCVELLQAFFLVADDIMDESKTRRGQPCWYLMPHVGNIAINDAFMLESAIFLLLKKHFKGAPWYVDVLELFHDVTFQTELGQQLDLLTSPLDSVDLSKFTLEKHSFIVIYKTAFYSFYLPVALAMHMVGIADPKDLQQAKDVLVPLGEYFQIQDDFLDCYGDPEVMGKIGMDIKDNKCSWVINKALQKASSSQRQILDQNYARKDDAAEKRVKEVFAELHIDQDYYAYEERIAKTLRTAISRIDESRGFKGEVLSVFMDKIYKRKK